MPVNNQATQKEIAEFFQRCITKGTRVTLEHLHAMTLNLVEQPQPEQPYAPPPKRFVPPREQTKAFALIQLFIHPDKGNAFAELYNRPPSEEIAALRDALFKTMQPLLNNIELPPGVNPEAIPEDMPNPFVSRRAIQDILIAAERELRLANANAGAQHPNEQKGAAERAQEAAQADPRPPAGAAPQGPANQAPRAPRAPDAPQAQGARENKAAQDAQARARAQQEAEERARAEQIRRDHEMAQALHAEEQKAAAERERRAAAEREQKAAQDAQAQRAQAEQEAQRARAEQEAQQARAQQAAQARAQQEAQAQQAAAAEAARQAAIAARQGRHNKH